MRFVSLFSGVGGFDIGLERAGWECVGQVEWDSSCQQVLAAHWPGVCRWGDVRDVSGDMFMAEALVFGSPCQDLSVAGRQAGLEGERSGLFFEGVRIIKEMRDATGNRFPRWVVWENVAGALSSNKGNDFEAVLQAFANIGAVVIEWHVLDARWFGVPQRRRRVFVVACFDPSASELCPEPILPVSPRSSWDPPTSRQPRPGTTSAATGSFGGAGADAAHAAGWLIPDISPAVTSKWAKGTGGPSGDECQNLLARPPAVTYAFDSTFGGQSNVFENHTPPVKIGSSADIASPPAVYTPGAAVRRLTPLECERLMGWPDNHTLLRADGREQSDTQRYKQCGNGVVAPVAEWIAHHINRCENSLSVNET